MNKDLITSTTASRVAKVMRITGTKSSELVDRCKLTSGSISQKKNGLRPWKTAELVVAIELFREKGVNVSLDYLTGLSDVMEPNDKKKEAPLQAGA